jgi:hypothetical protein
VRGANKAWVLTLFLSVYTESYDFSRALESTVQKHASSSSTGTGTFPGQGNALNTSSSAATPRPEGSKGILSDIYAFYSGLDPQVKVLIWVLVAYFGFMKLA